MSSEKGRCNYKEYIVNSFNSYCIKILKNERRNIQKKFDIQEAREKPLDKLTPKEMLEISNTYVPSKVFRTIGLDVVVKDELIVNLLEQFNSYEQTIILLSYFRDMTDKDIAEKLDLVRRTVTSHRNKILKEMKQILEGYNNEK